MGLWPLRTLFHTLQNHSSGAELVSKSSAILPAAGPDLETQAGIWRAKSCSHLFALTKGTIFYSLEVSKNAPFSKCEQN